jgi:hypothetical protein
MPRNQKPPPLLRREIHNRHNVYILGAGFSKAAGLPLTSEFLTKMREAHPWLDGGGRGEEAKAIAEVFALRRVAAGAAHRVKMNVENIEDLFSFASAVERGRVAPSVSKAIAATLDYCELTSTPLRREVRVAPATTGPVPNAWRERLQDKKQEEPFLVSVYETALAAMLGLLKHVVDIENTIITFNYDLVVEHALRALRVPYSYGWRDPRTVFRDEGVARGGLPLLKLHGSINWVAGRRKNRMTRPPTAYAEYEHARKAGEVPVLVPPSWAKTFSGVLLDVWNEAVERLSTATRIIVIGFSMPATDTHFKYLLAAGLRENVSLREILFVNPDAEMQMRIDGAFTEYAPTTLHSAAFERFSSWSIVDRGSHEGLAFYPV